MNSGFASHAPVGEVSQINSKPDSGTIVSSELQQSIASVACKSVKVTSLAASTGEFSLPENLKKLKRLLRKISFVLDMCCPPSEESQSRNVRGWDWEIGMPDSEV